MAEVNAEHQAIEKPEVAVAPYLQYIAPRSAIEQNLTPAQPNPDGSLSVKQAQFDVNSLFDTLHKYYGLYDFYGGDKVFEAARQQALEDCESAQTMDVDVLQQILLDNLSFITDQHFSIGEERPASLICPCFFTEVSFEKSEEGYRTADGKLVESVEGQDDLEELFKRSLTKEGEIVYWPITFAEIEEAKNNPPSLVVHYTDGSEQTLTAMAYESPKADPEVQDVKLYEDDGIPVFYSRMAVSQDFVDSAKQLAEEKTSIVDLTCNTGGYYDVTSMWWKNYLGKIVPTNSFSINSSRYINMAEYLADYAEELGLQEKDGWSMMNAWPDDFVANENLLVILTSKATASSAEMFVDAAHNAENTLVIGENTAGCYINNSSTDTKLMYSRIEVNYGDMVTIFPEGDFVEAYGYEPDLWCPSVWSQEAAINLVQRLK